MSNHTPRHRAVARAVTVALWAVGSAYLVKTEIANPAPDPVVIGATPVVWAVVIALPILASHAWRERQWLATGLIWLAAIVGSIYTLQGTLGRQAEAHDVLVARAADTERQRARIQRDLNDAREMLAAARRKCGEGRECLASTRATIGVYEGAVAGHEHRLSQLRVADPAAGERRIAALLSFATGADLGAAGEIVSLVVPALFGLTLELAAFAVAMLGWHPVNYSNRSVQSAIPAKPTPPPTRPRSSVFRKSEALSDVVQFSQPIQQEVLAARWNVTKSMVSMWLSEWEADGMVERKRNGKHKTVKYVNHGYCADAA